MSQPLHPMGGDLVTGEAVVLELRLAKLPSRGLAKLIDLAVQVGALLVLALLLTQVSGNADAGAAIGLCVTVAVIVGYPLVFETLGHGRTLGKLALGLRVVRDDGGDTRFRHALARALVGIIEIWLTLGVVAVVASMISTKGKRLGDMLAGTVAVHERVPVSGGPMVHMPPMLAGWAATLELSRLPDDLALSARQFMARAHDLAAPVRVSLAYRLASDVARYVAPGPPPGCPPEVYLAAVLSERRRREFLRQQPPQQPLGYATYAPAATAAEPARPVPASPADQLPPPPPGFAPPT